MADLYLECNSGISGDMAVAALLDAGADEKVLQKSLDSIPVKGFKTEITRVSKNGIDCCDFNVILDAEHENHDHDMEYLFGHENDFHHHEDDRHSERSEESVDTRCFADAQHDDACHSERSEESIGQRHSEGLPEESLKKSFSFTEKQNATNAKGFIYIVTNKTKTTLYIGVTSDLRKRIYEHKSHALEGFTAKYNCENLVYFECFSDIKSAIEREKYLKGKNREYKENLINSINPSWLDLYDYLFKDVSVASLPQHDDVNHFGQQFRHSEQSEESLKQRHSDGLPEEFHHHHDNDEHHHHEHRNLSDVLAIIDKTEMTDGARNLAHKIFQIIAEAESKAHGLPIEQVHFHEVGAIDSIVDVIALSVCFDNLNPKKVFVPFMNEGTGTVRCQHGILPIPVPAVANIVQKYSLPLHLISDKGEFITPTGAAFVAAVMTDKVLPESFEIKKIGLGAGKRTYSRPSILRAFIIEEDENAHHSEQQLRHSEQQLRHSERSEESIGHRHSECNEESMNKRYFADAQYDESRHSEDLSEESVGQCHSEHSEESVKRDVSALPQHNDGTFPQHKHKNSQQYDHETSDEIIKLETNIDDCSSESLGFVMDELLAAGARDVNYIPCFMKKNRPAYLLTVICKENERERLEKIIFKNTTTIGIRRSVMKRTILDREELELESSYGKFRAKKVQGIGVSRILPEYDDVAEIARKSQKSFGEIYSELSEICTKVLN